MKTRAFWIISSVLALGETAPTLDHAVLEKIHEQTAYEFQVRPHGIVYSNCEQGESRVRVSPLKTFYVDPDAPDEEEAQQFQLVRFQSRICTEFGYRHYDMQLYLPSDLMTLQVNRTGASEIQLTWIADAFEEPESTPIKMTLAAPEFMGAVDNWQPSLLPWSEIYFDTPDPFLTEPLVMDGKINQITRSDRT
jgi:hypothetical protein